jgi:hypothetical protein
MSMSVLNMDTGTDMTTRIDMDMGTMSVYSN